MVLCYHSDVKWETLTDDSLMQTAVFFTIHTFLSCDGGGMNTTMSCRLVIERIKYGTINRLLERNLIHLNHHLFLSS